MYIQKLVKNQGQSDKPCESVLGDETAVHTVANMWEYADYIHIIGLNGYIEGIKGEGMSSEQIEAFEKGLAVFPEFMEKCYAEMKSNELRSAPKSAG